MKTMLHASAAALATVLTITAMPAIAQDGDDDNEMRRSRVAIGPGYGPSYPGDSGGSFMPYIDFDRARGNAPFAHESPDESFSFPILSAGNFYVGPSVALVGKRDEKDTAPGMREVKTSVELGGAMQAQLSDQFYGFAELRKAVSGHDGVVARGGIDYVLRDGDNWLVSLGPRIKWADNTQTDAYFGVNEAEALATGLDVYRPGSGIQSVGATLGGDIAVSGPWGLAGYVAYERLVGDAADSPVTREFGSRDQIGGGIALSYSFGG